MDGRLTPEVALAPPADEPAAGYPLSPQQRRAWSLAGEAGCAVAGAVEIAGELDERALTDLIARHEILRVRLRRFPALTLPLQVVAAEAACERLPNLDLSHHGEGAQRLRIAELLDGMAAGEAPLTVRRIDLGGGRAVLLLALPAVNADFATLDHLLAELALPSGAAPGVQYPDAAELFRQLEAEPDGEMPAPPPEDLLAVRSEAAPFAPRALRLALEPDLLADLEVVAWERGLARQALLLAGWQWLLGCHTGEPRALTGVALDGRIYEGMEGALGPYTRYLPVSARLAPGRPFVDLAAELDRVLADLAAVQDRLTPERALGQTAGSAPRYTPFCFRFEEPAAEPPFRLLRRVGAIEPFHLELVCRGLDLELRYDPDRFTGEEAGRLASQLLALYRGVARAPETRLGELAPASQAERHQVRCEINDTAVHYDGPWLLHTLFEEQAARTPAAMAVSWGDEHLTYAELDGRADRLAGHLAGLGVGPDAVVAIHLERSPALVVAILAALKSGGAYLPLDPDYPAARLERMAAASGAAVLLTERRLGGRLAAPALQRVDLDEIEPALALAPPARVPGRTAPDHLAYVLFTSGSTGVPKGVMISHRAIVNHMRWMQEAYPLTPDDRVLQKTPAGFDASVWEFFAPLLAGGCLVLARPGGHRDPAYLTAELRARRVTVLQVVPTLLRLLLAEPGFPAAPCLRRVFCGGEALAPDLAASFAALMGAELINVYGPTEATIHAASWRARGPVRDTVPIGRPIANGRIYVVGEDREPVPAGMTGELWVGGANLARGYLGDPAQTAERFVPDPWSGEAGARLYRTGDRVRLGAAGDCEFLGRLDQQVKIRGFRVEPGEIEATLRRSPAVRDAAVVARGAGGETELVAYVVPTGTAADLGAFLRERLPEPMVPSRFVFLAALPLTPSGKVDRGALPESEEGEPASPSSHVAPRNPLEERVAALWAEVLRLERVGVEDDFFALGGHSLSAIRLVARLREELGVALPLGRLFAAPTVAGLATAVRECGPAAAPAAAAVPDPEHAGEPFPLTRVQQAYWIGRRPGLELGGVGSHEYLEVDGTDLDPGRLGAAWRRLVDRHGILRAVTDEEGYLRVLPSVEPYAVRVFDLRGLSGEAAGRALAAIRHELSHQLFATETWPLFAVGLSLLPAGRCRLHLSLDLLICDARSLQILARELVELYADPGAPLPPRRLSFRDYVLAAARLEEGADFERSRDYWLARAATLPLAPRLPLARNPATLAAPRFSRRPAVLPAALWQRLQERARRMSLSPPAVLLAAFAEVLAAWSRERRFTLNLPVANRLPLHPEVADVVGDFTTLSLLEVDLTAAAPFAARARRLQDRLWEDLDHRHFHGIEVLREVARVRGRFAAAMPVVFTSTLGLEGEDASGSLARLGEVVYRLTQTPQVWLDLLVSELPDGLHLDWDAVDALFPPGLLDEMIAAHLRLLAALAEGEEAWDAPDWPLLSAEQLRRREELFKLQEPRLDAVEKIDFKLAQHGLRGDLSAEGLVDLPGAEPEVAAYAARRSVRRFLLAPVALEDLGRLLACLSPVEIDGLPVPKRRYPSAGGLYAVDAYLHVQGGRVTGLPDGSYAYATQEHGLVPLRPGRGIDRSLHAAVNREAFDGCAFSLFLVGRPGAMAVSYGERAEEFCRVEAGAMGQLLMAEAQRHRIGLCPVGRLDDATPLRDLLALDGDQVLLHSFLGGGVAPDLTAAAILDGLMESAGVPVPRSPRPAGSPQPRTGLEQTIAEVWREVLGVAEVGRGQPFFELGGNSLHLVQAALRLGRRLGREVTVGDLFRHPTIESLAERLGEPVPAAGGALTAIAERAGRARQAVRQEPPRPAAPAVSAAIVPDPAARCAPFPLTDLQQAYWVARTAGFELGDVAVHCYQELEAADLDLTRLERAWQRVIERHDMLRAVVLPDGRQCVLERVPVAPIPLCDLIALTPEAAGREIAALRNRTQRTVFRGDQWPLFDVRAVRLPGGRLRVCFAFDGLVLDGWSYHLLFADLVELYRHPERRLLPLALSFRDYVLAERELRASDPGMLRARELWRARLPELPPPPALPVERGKARGGHPGFVRRSFTLDAATWRRLKHLASRSGLTATGVALAAYAEVVATWSAGSRFTLSLPRFNRLPLHPEVERVVGEFASFGLIAIDFSRREPFRERARRVQTELWQTLEHGGVDGVELARGRGQETAAAPVVFTSMLGIADQDASAPLLELGEIVYRVTQTPQVWLDCLVQEHAGELRCDWDAVAGLFPPGVVEEMLATFAGLLRDLAADEESEAAWERPGRLPLPSAQAALMAALNDTAAPPPQALPFALVRRQAEARPDAVAVIGTDRTLTYGELLRLATAWGAELCRLGARPGRPVAVVMGKGWEQAVAVLAVLAAGAPFLPVDPAGAPERLRRILEIGGIDLVLTQARLDTATAWPDGVRRLCLDSPSPAPDPAWQPGEPRPEEPAYVLFTSGSTGSPKGAMISQLGLANALAATLESFGIGAGDRVLALTALHHDMSLFDLLGVLAAGGSLVLPEPARVRDPGHWLDLLARHEVTIWNSVPAMMEMLLEYVAGRPVAPLRALRLAFLGGDWIPLSLPDRLRRLAPGVQLVSVGGPTETTLWNVWYRIGAVGAGWRSIPYGRPIANNRYHVLGDTLDPCPVWVPGELCCAGVGLALGYWGDEEAGRRVFVADPRTGERLYRTGDLGRLLPDGNLEILGRADHQIKIDGQRIEPGEIEAALLAHPQVTAAVVVPVGERGSLRLAAFAVLDRAAAGEKVEFKLGQPGLRPAAGEPAVALPGPEAGEEEIRQGYVARRSYRRFLDAPCSGAALGDLLGCLRPADLPGSPLPKYRYPSAGGLYTVEIRLEVKPGRVDGLPGGTYRYDPVRHGLERIDGSAAVGEDHLPVNRETFAGAAFTLYLIGDVDAVAAAYGEQAEPFCLLEAGALGQLLMSAGPEQGLGLCPVGRMARPPATAPGRRLLHVLLGGPIAPGQREVAAFLAEASGGAPDLPGMLRAHLRQRLPEFMVPASWTFLDALPLSANGKVDRAALARRAAGALPGPASAAPRSELERAIAEIWREVLGDGAKPGVDDNFFDLGGNSLQLIQVHRRLIPLLGRDLPLVAMFRRPTIRALAAEAGTAAVPIPSIDDRVARQRRAFGQGGA